MINAFQMKMSNMEKILSFCAQTDDVLRAHLDTKQSRMNSLLWKYKELSSDETTDVSNKEKLSVIALCCRYNNIHEVILDFFEVQRIAGEVLSSTFLKPLGLSLRGQCYDGASNMAGARLGCKSLRLLRLYTFIVLLIS